MHLLYLRPDRALGRYLDPNIGLTAGKDGTEEMDILNFCNSTYKFENKGEPYFDNITKRNYTAAVGQPAYLHCRVKNLGDREVSWIRKKDLHILTVGVHKYSSDARFAAIHTEGSDEWILRVANAQLRDSGPYECQVSTEPKISIPFFLTVVVSKAEILSGSEVLVRAGSDINLTCVVTHAPNAPSFIYWYRGRNVINYAFRGGISVETEQLTRKSCLLIARATVRDSGNYTCAPSNSDSASILVHVVNGERPAAMQSRARKLAPTLPCVLLTTALFNRRILRKQKDADYY